MTTIILISSDNVEFKVDKNIFNRSIFITEMFKDNDIEDNILHVQNVNSYYLKHIIDFCEYISKDKNIWYKIPKPLPSDISKFKDIPIIFLSDNPNENIYTVGDNNTYCSDDEDGINLDNKTKIKMNLPEFYVNFIKRFRFKELNELCEKSTYLIINPLTKLICACIACIIKNTSIEDIDKLISENSYLYDY